MSKQPKVYFIDTGLRNALMRTFADKPDGHLFENYICSELLKAGYIPKYWHTKSKAEVDFIIEKGNELIAIECKLQADPAMIPTGLRSFILTYRPKRAFVVSYQHTTGDLTLEGCSVKVCDTLSLLEELNR